MLSNIGIVIFVWWPENRDFRFKREALAIKMLQQCYFVEKAEKAVSPCNKALVGLQNGPRCTAKRSFWECRDAFTSSILRQKGG